MTGERKMTRLYCGKAKGNHEVGAVYATAGGMVLRVSLALYLGAGERGRREVSFDRLLEVEAIPDEQLRAMPLDDIPHELTDYMYAYCDKCRSELPGFQALQMFRSAEQGVRAVRLYDGATVRRTWAARWRF